MKDKLETGLFILGGIALLGILISLFTGGVQYFITLWIFILSVFGLFYGKTVSIFFVFSTGVFARVWGVLYFVFLVFWIYGLYLILGYEEPKTLLQYLFGTDTTNDLRILINFMKTFLMGIVLFGIIEMVLDKLKDAK